MFCGSCAECSKWTGDGDVSTSDGNYYCNQCWEYDTMRNTRCFSFAVIYDDDKNIISVGGNRNGVGCAERVAMWKLDMNDVRSKTIVVSRIRRCRGKMTYGTSKPCQQCIITFPFYNIKRVCYSNGDDKFCWEDAHTISNSYKSCSNSILCLSSFESQN